MALPARLAAALGRHPDDLTEDDLQRAVEDHVPESVDLDWKKDFYKATDADKKELAKDASAMANTAGGMVVIGVDDGHQDHAHALAPSTRSRAAVKSGSARCLRTGSSPSFPTSAYGP
jgi:hypothetical protein